MSLPSPVAAAVDFDPERKFVRVRELRPDGLVEFDFAIGEPELFVEMMLHAAAFDDFCARERVTFISEPADDRCFDDKQLYRLSRASSRNY